MLLFSVFVLLRGHNDPGGGFIGGLIAVSAVAIYGIAFGVPAARRALYFHPLAIAGAGLLPCGVVRLAVAWPCACRSSPASGRRSISLASRIDLSTVMAFDIGVYLVVVGALSSVALALEDREDG